MNQSLVMGDEEHYKGEQFSLNTLFEVDSVPENCSVWKVNKVRIRIVAISSATDAPPMPSTGSKTVSHLRAGYETQERQRCCNGY